MSVNRRRFVTTVAAAGVTAFLGADKKRPGVADERRLAIACIGVGGRGETNAQLMVSEDVKALCDVDQNSLTAMQLRYPQSQSFVDWRELINKVQCEGVVVSTPDHQHALIALAAMKRGMHVYLERPLAHTIKEVRQIEALAKEKDIVVWGGNQHRVSMGYQRTIDLLESNAIGAIKEVHAWTHRPTWPQGSGVTLPLVKELPPTSLNWDLWLGPAPEWAYNSLFHPVAWRGWWPFGGGPLVDMGPHLLDPLFTSLKLDATVTITPSTSEDGNNLLAPSWSIIRFDFPARGKLPPLALTWYDGGKSPPPELVGRTRMPLNGAVCVGERGRIFIPDLGRMPKIIERTGDQEVTVPESPMVLTRGHQQDWLDACRKREPRHDQLSADCRLTELCLAGTIAVRVNRPLKWNPGKGEFDETEANKLLASDYRQGWESV